MSERGLFPAEPIEAPEKASQTLLAHIERCPFSGMLYLKHRGSAQSARMAGGEMLHAVLERITNMCIENEEIECPPEVGKEIAQAMMEERVDLALPTDEQEAVRTMAWNFCAATVFDLEHIVAVETMFETTIGNWQVRGKIDRAEVVGDELFVRDYKSGLAIPSQEAFERGFQGPFYGLTVVEGVPEGDSIGIGEGISGVHIIEEYPRHRSDEGPLVSRHTYLDRAQLFDFKRTVEVQLARLDHGLAKNEWAAQAGTHCARCPAPQECPIPEAVRDIRTIATMGEASEVAERVLFLESESSGLKKAMRAYADEHGAIPAGSDLEFGFTLTESDCLADKDGLFAFLEEHGVSRDQFFKHAESTRFGKRKVKEAA